MCFSAERAVYAECAECAVCVGVCVGVWSLGAERVHT
jgi:hypothetical protein